ncbi:MAG: pirin family protein [Burkholderiaceae bacterium]
MIERTDPDPGSELDDELTHPVQDVIAPREKDLGGFTVRRVLPAVRHKLIGPFIFFDQMGPVTFSPGEGINVRPHPHIGLATVTYLFDGEFRHQDSLGTDQMIYPGAVNWMIAGRGITHSERTSDETRAQGHHAFGIQTWVALPKAHEQMAPAFEHHPRSSLPLIKEEGVKIRVILGHAFDQTAPVQVFSKMFYVDVRLEAGKSVEVPIEYEERAAYVVEGSVSIDGQAYDAGRMLVLRVDTHAVLTAGEQGARLMLAGGEPIDGPRFISWNFVASSQELIEQAHRDWRAADWANGPFKLPPGDQNEYIPLPDPAPSVQ